MEATSRYPFWNDTERYNRIGAGQRFLYSIRQSRYAICVENCADTRKHLDELTELLNVNKLEQGHGLREVHQTAL